MATAMPDGRTCEEPREEQSLDALYREHAPRLARHCLRLTGDRDAADDLLQEVFVRFIARFPVAPAEMNVGAYLHAMARNVWWKQLRDRHEVPDDQIERSIGADDDIDVDPERAILLQEQRGQVRRCAALLTGHQQRALAMREVEGHSYAEIGGTLGLGADAVAQVVSRGRARLRVVLRRAQVDVDELAPECRAMLAPLSAYLDGHESGSPEVAAHLERCERCRATLESYREAGFRFRGLTPLAPLAGVLARVGDAFRAGVEGPAAVAVASLATAAVLAASGGGLLIAKDLASSSAPHVAAVTTVARVALPVAHRPLAVAAPTVVRRHRAAAIHEHRPARKPHVRAGAPIAPVAGTVPATTPSAPPVTARVLPAATTTTTPAVSPRPTAPITGVTTAAPVVTPVVDIARKISVPAVTTPAVATPPVEVPAVTVPSVTTPSITTPVATVPSVTTPAIASPSVSVAPVATPVVTTPEVKLPGIKIGPVG
jgi:RNA polymerase sigma factor (sigma-70 family)